MKEIKLIDFAAMTASAEPVPGGGSIAAVSGSLAAALSEIIQETRGAKAEWSKNTKILALHSSKPALRNLLCKPEEGLDSDGNQIFLGEIYDAREQFKKFKTATGCTDSSGKPVYSSLDKSALEEDANKIYNILKSAAEGGQQTKLEIHLSDAKPNVSIVKIKEFGSQDERYIKMDTLLSLILEKGLKSVQVGSTATHQILLKNYVAPTTGKRQATKIEKGKTKGIVSLAFANKKEYADRIVPAKVVKEGVSKVDKGPSSVLSVKYIKPGTKDNNTDEMLPDKIMTFRIKLVAEQLELETPPQFKDLFENSGAGGKSTPAVDYDNEKELNEVLRDVIERTKKAHQNGITATSSLMADAFARAKKKREEMSTRAAQDLGGGKLDIDDMN